MDLHIKLTLNPFLSQLKIVNHSIYTLYLGKVPKTPRGGVHLILGGGQSTLDKKGGTTHFVFCPGIGGHMKF